MTPLVDSRKYGILKNSIYSCNAACICKIKDSRECRSKNICARLVVSEFECCIRNGVYERHLQVGIKKTLWPWPQWIGGLRYHYVPGNYGVIDVIQLEEDYRDKGIGNILLRHALQKLDEERVVKTTLDVAKWNHRALALYKKCNFVVYGEYKNRDVWMVVRKAPDTKNPLNNLSI
jgi:ribosomal protein S18 acetylase RimI-like enzyme